MLDGAIFDKSIMSETQFSESKLRKASFRSIVAPVTNFGKADMRGADFTDADIDSSNLADANAEDCIFVRTKFGKAILWKTNFKNADLTNADTRSIESDGLVGTNFERAVLTGTSLEKKS